MGRKAVTVLPQMQKLLSLMGEQIRLARLRRRLASELVAERAGVSRQTVTAIEKGCASVSLGAYANVLHALGGLERDLLLIAKDDELGRMLQDLELPQRLQDLELPQRKRAPRESREKEKQ
ncbi:MAG: helix-turn-helix domain-containing protein [Succinivibrionaceae bacterium]|nr:helix-turn-helix domain-containing protein [Succinivibrionaceae bacterium]